MQRRICVPILSRWYRQKHATKTVNACSHRLCNFYTRMQRFKLDRYITDAIEDVYTFLGSDVPRYHRCKHLPLKFRLQKFSLNINPCYTFIVFEAINTRLCVASNVIDYNIAFDVSLCSSFLSKENVQFDSTQSSDSSIPQSQCIIITYSWHITYHSREWWRRR